MAETRPFLHLLIFWLGNEAKTQLNGSEVKIGGLGTNLMFIGTILDIFLWVNFPCVGSDIAFISRQLPEPGVDDFPRVFTRRGSNEGGGAFFLFDEMAVSRFRQFIILNETFGNTQRSQTFTLPIYLDDVPEEVEEFNLTLSLLPDTTLRPGSVTVSPAVATVRIQDNDCKFLKLFDYVIAVSFRGQVLIEHWHSIQTFNSFRLDDLPL